MLEANNIVFYLLSTDIKVCLIWRIQALFVRKITKNYLDIKGLFEE